MPRPQGEPKKPTMINIKMDTVYKINKERVNNPRFDLSKTVNELLEQYFKMKGHDIKQEEEDIQKEEEELLSKLTIIQAKKKEYEIINANKEKDEQKKLREKYGV